MYMNADHPEAKHYILYNIETEQPVNIRWLEVNETSGFAIGHVYNGALRKRVVLRGPFRLVHRSGNPNIRPSH